MKWRSLRLELVASFVLVVSITGLSATLVGVHLLAGGVFREKQTGVQEALNTARLIYEGRLMELTNALALSARREALIQALKESDAEAMDRVLGTTRAITPMDTLTVVDPARRVVYRHHNPGVGGDVLTASLLLEKAATEQTVVAGTEIRPRAEMLRDGPDLAERARIEMLPTPRARPRPVADGESGMVMAAAVPIFDAEHRLLGLLYGGVLLNRYHDIVDLIRDTAFRKEVYRGQSIGTATIFEGDLRVATNVLTESGQRAIGTRVSAEVCERVLDEGRVWIDRAFVVKDWYITAYEPIRDVAGRAIGILYVGVLERKFSDLQVRTTWTFLGIAAGGMVIALGAAWFLAGGRIRPIQRLVRASEAISRGDLSIRVRETSRDEIGELERTFNLMASAVKGQRDSLEEQTRQQLIRSERLAAIGRLAAGVAHELNNPLTGVLIFSHLLLRGTDPNDPRRGDLETIVEQTNRCKEIVKGLLDFSRQSEPRKEPTDIRAVLRGALDLTENHARVHNVAVRVEIADGMDPIVIDGGQMQQVFVNIMLNAIDAMPDGGALTITAGPRDGRAELAVRFADTGSGISAENVNRIFDPFFTTKEPRRGTGLGLAISHGIVEKHGGRIEVESEVGRGSAFTVVLLRGEAPEP